MGKKESKDKQRKNKNSLSPKEIKRIIKFKKSN